MNTMYKAQFIFDKNVFPLTKNLYIEAYNVMRNEAVNRINPLLEEWNREYGKIDDISKYNEFINEKQQVILDELNSTFNESPVKLYSSEECDIVGKFIDCITKQEVTMHVELVPYN